MELVPFVPRLAAFPDKRDGAWSIRLRRPLLEISPADAALLRDALTQIAVRPADVVGEYLDKIKPVRRVTSAAG
ncbi:hypothetical protein [Nonomuraea sediminis]|uniref:hypothetical protein n=1 Tax=Nonomuraea sediminis TaxID=2835864 RepID=UPI00202ABF6C|nr:hypothetical protein [Nonomuraea sediminis]